MTRSSIRTLACGNNVDVTAPDLTDVSLKTIATHLAKICRYGGACDGFYSVARHSTLGALALNRSLGKYAARAFLLHDAHEAIVGDIITPVEKAMSGAAITKMKRVADHAVDKRFGADFTTWSGDVRLMDWEMLYYEWVRLMPGTPESVGIKKPPVCRMKFDIMQRIIPSTLSWADDRDRFLDLAKWLEIK